MQAQIEEAFYMITTTSDLRRKLEVLSSLLSLLHQAFRMPLRDAKYSTCRCLKCSLCLWVNLYWRKIEGSKQKRKTDYSRDGKKVLCTGDDKGVTTRWRLWVGRKEPSRHLEGGDGAPELELEGQEAREGVVKWFMAWGMLGRTSYSTVERSCVSLGNRGV